MLRALGHIVLWGTECSVHYCDSCHRRQNLGLVEAKNFVPYIWAPGTEGASGATGYARDHIVILRGRFLFWDPLGASPSAPSGSSHQPSNRAWAFGFRLSTKGAKRLW